MEGLGVSVPATPFLQFAKDYAPYPPDGEKLNNGAEVERKPSGIVYASTNDDSDEVGRREGQKSE